MVIADLAGFERLATDAAGGTIDGREPVPGGDVAVTAADTWASAARLLFRVPPPRLIVVRAGGAFAVWSGASLAQTGGGITLAPTAAGPAAAARLDVFRYAADAPPVPPPPGTQWVPAAHAAVWTESRSPAEVLWYSGHAAFNAAGTDLAPRQCVYTGAAAGAPGPAPEAVCRLTPVATDGHPPAGDAARAAEVWTMRAEFPASAAAGALPPAAELLTVGRCNGDALAAQGWAWNRMVYGWVIERAADSAVLAFAGGRPGAVTNARSLGCFLDRDGPGQRALDRLYAKDIHPHRGGRGWAECAEWAAGQSRTVFGLEAGGQCYVRGDDDAAAAQRWGATDRCTVGGGRAHVDPNTGMSLGGEWGVALYQLPADALQVVEYPECANSEACVRMPGRRPIRGRRYRLPDGRELRSLTEDAPAGCLDAIVAQQDPAWSGDPVPGGLLDRHFASTRGDGTDTRRIVWYNVPGGGRVQFLGIFRDDGGDRVLPRLLANNANQDPAVGAVMAAARLAGTNGRSLFGVEYGSEVWVGADHDDAARAMRKGGVSLAGHSSPDSKGLPAGGTYTLALYRMNAEAYQAYQAELKTLNDAMSDFFKKMFGGVK